MAAIRNTCLSSLIFVVIIALIAVVYAAEDQEQFFKRGHTNNWAVLVNRFLQFTNHMRSITSI